MQGAREEGGMALNRVSLQIKGDAPGRFILKNWLSCRGAVFQQRKGFEVFGFFSLLNHCYIKAAETTHLEHGSTVRGLYG